MIETQMDGLRTTATRSWPVHDHTTTVAGLGSMLASSRGTDGYSVLSPSVRAWLEPMRAQLPKRYFVHHDRHSQLAARSLGAAGFVLGDRIFLADHSEQDLDATLKHELVHLAQVNLVARGHRIDDFSSVEWEAEAIAALPLARPVQYGADPLQVHPIFWFVAIGVGLYILFRPAVANAPGRKDKLIASPSIGQIVGEAVCFFVIPGGAMSIGARLGLGFLGSAALAGATANVGLRAVSDAARGSLSSPLMYVFDAATGAILGFVVSGGVRLIGRAGTIAFDQLATYGLQKSDIALTQVLAKAAAEAPLDAPAAQRILQSRGLLGQVSKWWLDRRGMILLYRGQEMATSDILSPLARNEGVAASQEMVARLRTFGLSNSEIAGFTARWHAEPVPPFLSPPGMGSLPLGASGIPTTRIPGIAANFGDTGVIYTIRMPQSQAFLPIGWQGLSLESEYIIFDQVPSGAIVKSIPASTVAPLMVNESGLLVPGLATGP